ncbi:hypothetical protein CKO25_12640 [Thiocapsa imhoffii]|uniref:Nudix hydrolase domain-containing protein n=1 Tax=Thiocapsa imhoffii TaxID=382777 RepID=A0A9X0WJ68_9GAMM|nr:NUDIX domain-containing protein [Thiocapsa imhoffii]MBK1645475.1 hypothetical protein [Thiocapsa imhoffii]
MTDHCVLAFPRADLPPHWLPICGGLVLESVQLVETLARIVPVWLPRAQAEEQPSHKQLITYTLAFHRGQLACYWRQGTERRLHGLGSVGIGGHIEIGDAQENTLETLLAAARRELAEELPSLTPLPPLTVLGLINEEKTAVGRVHLGFVLLAEIDGERPPSGGRELGDVDWLDPSVARQRPLECWSRLALDLLDARCPSISESPFYLERLFSKPHADLGHDEV